MGVYETTAGDIREMARYWMLRKFTFLEWTSTLFMSIVDPVPAHGPLPDLRFQQLSNMAFTEWLLFECELRDGMTPLELYLAEPPRSLGEDSAARLRQVAETQFFSRFEILSKDRAAGVAALRDVRDGRRYDVADPRVCEIERWRDGTIAERIAHVDGAWTFVGQMHLYDVAPASETAVDGPGELHPEDGDEHWYLEPAGYFLRLVRDVMGAGGRYSETMRAVAPDGPRG